MMVSPLRSGAVASTTSSSVGTGTATGGFAQLVTTSTGTPSATNLTSGAGSNTVQYSTELARMSAEMNQMLTLQMAMQRENLMFTSISNVLKTKHDTLKTIISNIR